MTSRIRIAAGAALLTAAMTMPALANDAEKAIAYRQAVFKTFGWHMGEFSAMAKGEKPYDAAYAKAAADSMAALGAILAAAFDESTKNAKTKDEIWFEPEAFAAAVKSYQDASVSLAAVAGTGREALGAALRGVGASCKNCHDNFRNK